jgi:hypothetical protein
MVFLGKSYHIKSRFFFHQQQTLRPKWIIQATFQETSCFTRKPHEIRKNNILEFSFAFSIKTYLFIYTLYITSQNRHLKIFEI